MNNDYNKWITFWTIAWLSFIAFLCFIFNSGMPLFLLFIWILGF